MLRLISLLFFVVSVQAQEQDNVLRLRDFGFNTISGDLAVPSNMFREAIDVDWSRNRGSVTRRFGYDSVTIISGQDSIIGIYGAFYSDGSQQLFAVADSEGVGYGNIYKTTKGSNQFGAVKLWADSFNVHDSYAYTIKFIDGIFGSGSGDTITITYNSDASATSVEISAGLKAAIAASSDLTNKIDSGGKFSDLDALFNCLASRFQTNFYTMREHNDNINATVVLDTAQNLCVAETADKSRIATFFSIGEKPYFTMFNDNVVITTPSGRGIIWDGNSARNFPTTAPGEPLIIPIYDTGFGANIVNGEVSYSFEAIAFHTAGTAATALPGIMSSPVIVHNGRVLITNFPYVVTDSVVTTADSVRIVVRRTTDVGFFDDRDSMFLVDTLSATAANINTLVLIDSLFSISLDGLPVLDFDFHGRDSLRILTRRYGAPGYISADDSTYSSVTDTSANVGNGVFHGIIPQHDTLGVLYAVSTIDTSIGIESRLGIPLAIWVDTADRVGADKPYRYRISLPLIPAADSGIYRNLYRAHILQVTRDSLFNVNDSLKAAQEEEQKETGEWVLPIRFWKDWVNRLAVDTVTTSEFRLVVQIHPDSIAYTDSTRWDSLQVTGRVNNLTTPPLSLSNTFSYDGRIWGSNKSTVFYSRFDSAAAWGLFDRQILGQDDGDEVTLGFPTRTTVRWMKNGSSYNVFKSSVLATWDSREISTTFGCIAGRSYAKGRAGHYYLSRQGVVRENDGQFLVRTQAIENISQELDNFDKLSLSVKSKAEGQYFDDKYALSIGDSLYTYDEKENKWSIWRMPIGGSTLYGTESERNFLPGDTMYFFKPGDSTIFRYKTAENDAGTNIQMQIKTAPLFVDEYEYEMEAINFFCNGDATDELSVFLFDHKGNVLDMVDGIISTILVIDSLNERYRTNAMLPVPKQWFQFEIRSGANSSGNIIIDGIDIEYIRKTKKGKK